MYMDQGSFLALCFTLVPSLSALVDQCAYVNKAQALAAVYRLNPSQPFMSFACLVAIGNLKPCQLKPCLQVTTGYKDFWEVKVNDSGIDLAYTFLDAGIKNQKINLAAVVGCPAVEVSPLLP